MLRCDSSAHSNPLCYTAMQMDGSVDGSGSFTTGRGTGGGADGVHAREGKSVLSPSKAFTRSAFQVTASPLRVKPRAGGAGHSPGAGPRLIDPVDGALDAQFARSELGQSTGLVTPPRPDRGTGTGVLVPTPIDTTRQTQVRVRACVCAAARRIAVR